MTRKQGSDDTIGGAVVRREVLRFAAASAAGLLIPARGSASSTTAGADVEASTSLQSAGVLAFGLDNVLFVGDVRAGVVHAFALRETDLDLQHDVELGNFHNFEGRGLIHGIDRQIAALLGTSYDDIAINDMIVHPQTQQIFISVERGRSADIFPAIIKVDHGRLQVLSLDQIPHSKVVLPNVPDARAMLEFAPQRTFAITDVTYYNGEIFVAGISNQHFSSTLYRIRYPFNDGISTSTMEIWHAVHGEFETRAPIIRQLVREVRGEPHLFAVYGCTPLVRFPLSSLKDGAHVRGDVIGELGYGSNPVDMNIFTDPFDSKEYLLVTIDMRSASRIAVLDLDAAVAEPTGGPADIGPGGLGKTQGLLPIKAEHFAMLNRQWGVQIHRHPKAEYRLDLSTLAAPYFFERRDNLAEMNWPDGPDPNDYRGHRNDRSRGG